MLFWYVEGDNYSVGGAEQIDWRVCTIIAQSLLIQSYSIGGICIMHSILNRNLTEHFVIGSQSVQSQCAYYRSTNHNARSSLHYKLFPRCNRVDLHIVLCTGILNEQITVCVCFFLDTLTWSIDVKFPARGPTLMLSHTRRLQTAAGN